MELYFRGLFKTHQNIYDRAFLQKYSWQLKALNILGKKLIMDVRIGSKYASILASKESKKRIQQYL